MKSGIENPSKLEVIGRCGGDEKNRMTTQNRQKSIAKKKKKEIVWKHKHIIIFYTNECFTIAVSIVLTIILFMLLISIWMRVKCKWIIFLLLLQCSVEP